MKHKHADLIHAWADGAVIQQYKPHLNEWHDTSPYPVWDSRLQYRIKPEPKPDVELYAIVDNCINYFACMSHANKSLTSLCNLKLTFDGETGKLKSAEVIK